MSLLDIFIFLVCSGALLASHVRTLLVGKRGSVSGALNSARTLQPIALCPALLCLEAEILEACATTKGNSVLSSESGFVIDKQHYKTRPRRRRRAKQSTDPTKHVLNMTQLSFHAWVADSEGHVVHDPDRVGGPLEMKLRNNGALNKGRTYFLRQGFHLVYEEFEVSKSKAVLSWYENLHPHDGKRFKRIVHEIRTVGPMQDNCYANAFVYVQDSDRTDLHVAVGATRWVTEAGETPIGAWREFSMWEFGHPKDWEGVHW